MIKVFLLESSRAKPATAAAVVYPADTITPRTPLINANNPINGNNKVDTLAADPGVKNPIVIRKVTSPPPPPPPQTQVQVFTPQPVLQWPPVLPDGTIPIEDGYDIMTLTDLHVPKFWTPDEGVALEKQGRKVNGVETIFLMIASYRDFQCRETITSAFMRADHPEALFIGAVDQVSEGDTGCTTLDVSCQDDPNQMICKYWDQISIFKMEAELATGPVTARHIGDRMYRGEYFVMQMDAHCHFIRHWDTKIKNQWKETKNEMAVLSSYLTDYQGSIDANGDSTRDTRPIMCNSAFEGMMPARYLRHGSQPEDYAVIRDMPQLQPFWAAGFSFSRGHFKVRVPYDGYQPMVFQVSFWTRVTFLIDCREKRFPLGSEVLPLVMIFMLQEIQSFFMSMQRDLAEGRKFICFGKTLQSIKGKRKIPWLEVWQLSKCHLISLTINGIMSRKRSMGLEQVISVMTFSFQSYFLHSPTLRFILSIIFD